MVDLPVIKRAERDLSVILRRWRNASVASYWLQAMLKSAGESNGTVSPGADDLEGLLVISAWNRRWLRRMRLAGWPMLVRG